MNERIVKGGRAVLRHTFVELAEHWLLALSGLMLIFSGFGELPMYKRFMVTKIPGLGWAGDFFINLKIHYLSGIVFVSVMVFHALYHGWLGHRGLLPRRGDLKASFVTILSMFGLGNEPKSDKYLPEQRLAYAYLGGVGSVLVLTGLVKVIKNLPGVYLPPPLVTSMTLTHTFGTIFFLIGVLAHLSALIFKVNRPLTKSIFTGEVDLDYVKERHTLWYEDLKKRGLIERKQVHAEAEVENEENGKVMTAPEVKETKPEEEGNTMPSIIRVKGMSCQHCVMSVTRALSQLEGIQNVQVDLQSGEVRFENTKAIPSDRIDKAIEEAGYEVISNPKS
ncbi:MAG: cytochrome b/b6 domain-containing protein [Syntrophaceae bacterium]|nr:cytochrome b/b6 domain-containing protein [Syntrophaceae bacterium]